MSPHKVNFEAGLQCQDIIHKIGVIGGVSEVIIFETEKGNEGPEIGPSFG